jgi:hypothetical protein
VIGVALGGVGVGIALAAASLGAIYSDYLSLRHQRDTMSVLLPKMTEQQGRSSPIRIGSASCGRKSRAE